MTETVDWEEEVELHLGGGRLSDKTYAYGNLNKIGHQNTKEYEIMAKEKTKLWGQA